MSQNKTKISKRAAKIIAVHKAFQSKFRRTSASGEPRKRAVRYAALDAIQAIDGAGLHPREVDAVRFLETYCNQMRLHISRIERAIL